MGTWKEHLKGLEEEFLNKHIMYNGTAYTVAEIDSNGVILIDMENEHGDYTAVYDEIEAHKHIIHTLDEIDSPAEYIPDETEATFGYMRIGGRLFPVSLSLNPGIPDALCNSIEIDGTMYRFDAMRY